MSAAPKYPHLFQFWEGYFHQDFYLIRKIPTQLMLIWNALVIGNI
jgi:hypothetical protein